ncbi:MAG: hypothetical protein ACRD4B_01195 [Acidobacteriota bacterium]
MKNIDPARDRREMFYPFGAAEGLLLDQVNPQWRDQYLMEKFSIENYVN